MQPALLLVGFLLLPTFGSSYQAEKVETADPWPAQAMPADRADDSYAIYTQLLPLGETANWPANYYDLQDITITAVPPGAPCSVSEATVHADAGGMNPHLAVSPPEKDREDYQEILADFDAHCHERISLIQSSWNAKLPVHLLDAAEQDEFRKLRHSDSPAAQKYSGSAALYAFSQAYFNVGRTVAMVYATQWCGGRCGQGFWVAFRRESDVWKQLRWNSNAWIS